MPPRSSRQQGRHTYRKSASENWRNRNSAGHSGLSLKSQNVVSHRVILIGQMRLYQRLKVALVKNTELRLKRGKGLLGLGNGKVCSEVEQRFLLYLAANSSALDQANGSIGFVGGAAGRCLGYKHSPILAKSKPLWESIIDFRLILWNYIENPGFHINKINVLPTPNRQNRLLLQESAELGLKGVYRSSFPGSCQIAVPKPVHDDGPTIFRSSPGRPSLIGTARLAKAPPFLSTDVYPSATHLL